ncbi:hypothetical protein [Siccirubricoccus sp. G192]|uniref:hypothetical protein n=1 Tax=Siccirubricoccus sp. G192 TaxID=2849651 RepID=UPI0020C3F2B9|nr:hypothetical protein [Siccirubricoccus sp. G192]
MAKDAAFRSRMEQLGADLPGLTPDGGTSPEAFEQFLTAERARWLDVARRSGAKVE